MNGAPHTHEARLATSYGLPGIDNPWMIVYGDTRVRVCNGLRRPTERLVRKATAKAIRRHDKGSQRAAEILADQERGTRIARTVRSEWGTNR